MVEVMFQYRAELSKDVILVEDARTNVEEDQMTLVPICVPVMFPEAYPV